MVQNWQSLFLPNCTGKVSHEARSNLEMGKRTSSLNERSCKVTLQEAKTQREVGNREPFCNLPPELYFFIVKVLHHNNGIESKDLSAPLRTNPIADFVFVLIHSGLSWRRKWQPTSVFLLGKPYGWRSLTSYSPRGCKESDMTEQLSTYSVLYIIVTRILRGLVKQRQKIKNHCCIEYELLHRNTVH